MRNRLFAYAKTKTQISFAVTAKLILAVTPKLILAVTPKLISAFVFATWIVQSLFFLNPKFQASSHLLWLYSPVCVGPGRKLRRPVSHDAAQLRLTRSENEDRFSINHYENTPMQYTAIFHGCKNDNFHLIFFTISIFLLKT